MPVLRPLRTIHSPSLAVPTADMRHGRCVQLVKSKHHLDIRVVRPGEVLQPAISQQDGLLAVVTGFTNIQVSGVIRPAKCRTQVICWSTMASSGRPSERASHACKSPKQSTPRDAAATHLSHGVEEGPVVAHHQHCLPLALRGQVVLRNKMCSDGACSFVISVMAHA